MWLKTSLYFIQEIDKKSHKCCSTLTANYNERFSVSISLNSNNFFLIASQSASNFSFHFSKYGSKNHEDFSSKIAEFTPKISLEGCLPFWLLFKMVEKKHAQSFLSQFWVPPTLFCLLKWRPYWLSSTCFALRKWVLHIWKVEARHIGLQYVGSSGRFTGHPRDSLFSVWLENWPSVVKGLNIAMQIEASLCMIYAVQGCLMYFLVYDPLFQPCQHVSSAGNFAALGQLLAAYSTDWTSDL